MADTTTKPVFRMVATTSSKVRDLVIQDGSLIFIQDLGRIAFDFKGKRVFYNQIVELETEADRSALEEPLSGYYFVISTACLWFYKNEWVKITNEPENILFVGVELPQLGQENKIYANTTEGAENISVWDEDLGRYVVVADKTQEVSEQDILNLFV